MALIKEVRGFTPAFGDDCYFAENATLIGDLKMGDQCSVWFNAVIRGDVNSIRLGDRVTPLLFPSCIFPFQDNTKWLKYW